MSLVSVVIPTCNRPDLLKRAVDSVVSQDHDAMEIIIVDDGSSGDVTAETFGDARVVVVRGNRRGPGAARNVGIQRATGAFVTFLDDDDHWLPGKVVASLAAFEKHPDAGMVFHTTGRPNRPDNATGEVWYYEHPSVVFATRPTPHVDSIMVRANAIKQTLFSEELPAGAEIDLMLRLAKRWPFVEIDKTYAIFDPSPDAPTGISLDSRIAARIQIGEAHPDVFGTAKARSFHAMRLGHLYRRNGQFGKATQSFLKGIALDPRSAAAWQGLGTTAGNWMGLRR